MRPRNPFSARRQTSAAEKVYGRCAQGILFLLGVKRLLLQFARLAGGLDLGAVLGKQDVSIADAEQGPILHLLQLCFEIPLGKDSRLVVRRRRTVRSRDLPL